LSPVLAWANTLSKEHHGYLLNCLICLICCHSEISQITVPLSCSWKASWVRVHQGGLIMFRTEFSNYWILDNFILENPIKFYRKLWASFSYWWKVLDEWNCMEIIS
jgi:hypothetical protein